MVVYFNNTLRYDPQYTTVEGVVNLILRMENYPARGTGISKLVDLVHNLSGPNIPPTVVSYVVGLQNNLFGSYPGTDEVGPSILFTVLFFIITLMHLLLFVINFSRGHFFWVSIGWIFYGLMRTVGFALRAVWASDVTLIAIGLTSEVLCIVPSIIIVSLNLILAQRLFTWRHPVGGSRKLFWGFMLTTYAVVILLIGVVIFGSFIPYLYFLNQSAYDSYRVAVKSISILVIAYSLTSIALIGLSFWLPTSKDENLYTYQPWWIESFSPFYFVQPGAAQRAEETFMKRNHNHRHAIRVIAATHHHYKMVKGLSNERGDLKHNISLLIIIISTVLIFIGAVGRCVVTFQYSFNRNASPAASKAFMYICWGAFEVIINILYIIGRVDLRFYRPDILPRKVRSIITAEQSYYPSDYEEDEESIEKEGSDHNRYDSYHPRESANGYEDADDESHDNGHWNFVDVDVDGSSISSPLPRAPYPHKEKGRMSNDNDSEFNF
ncbi:uncharacterized protein RJT21DRAFT_114367 [Scheffersomyces amazonensis]|uniref:uncharacterized protein n=1 Tax=Scheffersomyces amazonensis TaxID=1078765 RepID=UPI00315CCEB0